MKLIDFTTYPHISIKFRNRNILTCYNHYIMNLHSNNGNFDCELTGLECRIMTAEDIANFGESEFSLNYIIFLSQKYPLNFFGLILYCDGKPCGYICGMTPDSQEVQYKIKNCDFFVKYVFVSQEFRGKRIASELFKQLFLNIKADNVTFAVRKNNLSALKAYEKMGSKIIRNKKFIRVLRYNIPYHTI